MQGRDFIVAQAQSVLINGGDGTDAAQLPPILTRHSLTFVLLPLCAAVGGEGATAATAQLFVLEGHKDVITGLALAPTGTALLSNSVDRSLREWDIRAFAGAQRCTKIYTGATHGADRNLLGCSWSPSGEMVAAGSADRAVHIWDQPTAQELYYLPGHAGTVNDVKFHPREPIVASCGSDKNIYLGEL